MNNLFKFIKDILRDKGSVKYSITKTLALSTFLFTILYLFTYLIIFTKPIDHTLVLELIGFTSALVGLKNNWGKKNDSTSSQNKIEGNSKNIILDNTNDEEEGVF